MQASVGIPDSVDEMFAEFRKQFDRLDIVVSNAASGVLKPAIDMTLKHWRWCMETNALALNLLAQRAPAADADGRAHHRDVEPGRARAMPGYGFIGASKAALEALVRALAQELGPARHPRQRRERRASSTPTRSPIFRIATSSSPISPSARRRGRC